MPWAARERRRDGSGTTHRSLATIARYIKRIIISCHKEFIISTIVLATAAASRSIPSPLLRQDKESRGDARDIIAVPPKCVRLFLDLYIYFLKRAYSKRKSNNLSAISLPRHRFFYLLTF